jgi:hypothetical protein
MRWARYTVRTGIMKTPINLWSESLKGIDHLEDLEADETIILNWMLKYCGRIWPGFN